MTNTLVSQSEFDRIKGALFLALELVALESVVSTAVLPLNIIAILRGLPDIIAQIHRLVSAIEQVAAGFGQAERTVASFFVDERLGITEAAAVALVPLVKLTSLPGSVWVRSAGAAAMVSAPQTIGQFANQLLVVSKQTKPQIRIDTFVVGTAKRFVVYIPGTKSFIGGQFDMRTNTLELAGKRSPVEQAVEMALRKVGAGVGDRVTIVGHSLGGLVAMNVAKRSATGQVPYRVDNVIEIGSPNGLSSTSVSARVLSIEGSNDFVPVADALPMQSNINTLLLDQKGADPFTAHELSTYVKQIGSTGDALQRNSEAMRIDAASGTSQYFDLGVRSFG